MRDLIEECLRETTWAVVGYSANPHKFGHIIYHDLCRSGYRVFAVNRKGGKVGAEVIYPCLEALPEHPGVVDIVVPPKETEGVVEDCIRLGIERLWMQPGAQSPEAIRRAQRAGLKVVYEACVMVEVRSLNRSRRETPRP